LLVLGRPELRAHTTELPPPLELPPVVITGKASDLLGIASVSRLPGEPADGVDDVHFHPVEPRTLRATIRRQF